jgi:hypothetical protein
MNFDINLSIDVLNAQTLKWDQSVYIDGQLESTVSTSK